MLRKSHNISFEQILAGTRTFNLNSWAPQLAYSTFTWLNLLGVLNVLTVLNVLNVLNMPHRWLAGPCLFFTPPSSVIELKYSIYSVKNDVTHQRLI